MKNQDGYGDDADDYDCNGENHDDDEKPHLLGIKYVVLELSVFCKQDGECEEFSHCLVSH